MRRVPATLLVVLASVSSAAAQLGGAGGRQTFAAWSMSYAVPAGWQIAQQQGRVHTLVTPAGVQAGVIYVGPGMHQSFNDAGADLNKGFNALGLSGMPAGQPASTTIGGLQAMTADYVAQNQMGMQLRARVISVLTPHGTGFLVLGLAPAYQPGEVAAAVDRLAQSLQVTGPPRPDPQAVAALRGRWMYYAGRASGVTSATGGSSNSYEEFVEFDGVGRFTFQSSASVSVTTPGYTGSAGRADASSDEGTYTVIGTTLVVRGRQGQATFDLQILGDRVIADGKTYVRAN
jgi:hypothetical protein